MDNSDKKSQDQVNQEKLPKRWYELSLVQALSLVIVLALLIVSAAVKLYTSSENHKYDINRPGSKYNSPKLSINENTDIDTSSPVNQQTLKQINKVVADQLKKLAPYGDYSDKPLTVDNLGIAAQSKSSPADSAR